MIHLAALAIFSGLSLNLLLQFALGAASAAGDSFPKGEPARPLPLFQFGVLFITVIFLWAIFGKLLPPQWGGFSQYFLLFPVSALACVGFEFVGENFIPKFGGGQKVFSAYTAYDGLVPAVLVITFALAGDFVDTVVLALFFAAGNLTAMLILNEIRRRATLERVPRFIRGSPLILISMGLLALVSGTAAGICFKILGAIGGFTP